IRSVRSSSMLQSLFIRLWVLACLRAPNQVCLVHELTSRGLKVETQVPIPVQYRGVKLDAGYRLDLLVEDLVVVEVKAVERLAPIHEAQLLSYLRLTTPLDHLPRHPS